MPGFINIPIWFIFSCWILSNLITECNCADNAYEPSHVSLEFDSDHCHDPDTVGLFRMIRENAYTSYRPCPKYDCYCLIDYKLDYIAICSFTNNTTCEENISVKTTMLILSSSSSYNKISPACFAVLPNLLTLKLFQLIDPIGFLRTGVFQKLHQLETLVIHCCDLIKPKEIDADAFTGFDSLKHLDLSDNFISGLSDRIFYHLNCLQSLDLSLNSISSLPDKLFEYSNHLKYLDLSYNVISSISKHTFSRLIALEYLKMSFNGLDTIEYQAFDAQEQLKSLDLSGNFVHILHDGLFSHLVSLVQLNLSNNKLDFFDFKVFVNPANLLQPAEYVDDHNWYLAPVVNLTELRHIDVSHNDIQFSDFCGPLFFNGSASNLSGILDDENVIYMFVCVSTPNLSTLNISYNGIVTAEFFERNKMSSLERLYMENILINVAKNVSLETLDRLKVLSLKRSNLMLEENSFMTFQNLGNLEDLDVSGVKAIVHFRDGWDEPKHLTESQLLKITVESGLGKPVVHIRSLASTQRLNLNQLDIKNLAIDDFAQFLNLKSLHLSGNDIESVNFSSLPSHLWTQLDEIDLSHNPFSCECSIMWFLKWINMTNVAVLNIDDPLAYMCMYPQEKKGIPILNNTNMNHCYSALPDFLLISLCRSLITYFVLSLIASLIHKFRWHVRYLKLQIQNQTRQQRDLIDQREYTYDAFVMYSSEDSQWIKQHLCPQLENNTEHPLHLCLHERDWQLGKDIVQNIVESIESSRKCLMIVSNAFVTSNWCNYEMNLIQSRTITEDCSNTILVLREEVAPINITPRLRLQMQSQTYIEWTEDEVGQKLFWARLKQAMKKPQHSLVHELPPRSEVIRVLTTYRDNVANDIPMLTQESPPQNNNLLNIFLHEIES